MQSEANDPYELISWGCCNESQELMCGVTRIGAAAGCVSVVCVFRYDPASICCDGVWLRSGGISRFLTRVVLYRCARRVARRLERC